MDTTPPNPADPQLELLVAAAIDRAQRHRTSQGHGVLLATAAEHLGYRSAAHLPRRVRRQFDALEQAGIAQRIRRKGLTVWTLTSRGERQLADSQQAGTLPALPEAPQHARWRNAHTAARERIDEFRESLADVLAETLATLNATRPAESDEWFTLATRLQRAAWLLGCATYCLNEWAEPNDQQADTDTRTQPHDSTLPREQRRRLRQQRDGRRDTRQWKRDW
jgi:hypothetical protein